MIGAVASGAAYTVYHACHSGSLASLELAAPGWKLPEPVGHSRELGDLFEFTAADLDANRAGMANLRQLPFGRVARVLFFGVGFALAGLGCVFELLKKPTLLAFASGLVFWLLSAGVLYLGRGLCRDLVEQRSCSVSGTLTDVSTRYSKSTSHWRLTIAEKTIEFPYPDRSTSLLRIGSRYRAHYLCHSQHLVSIEPLS
jgi:hypothetical protein